MLRCLMVSLLLVAGCDRSKDSAPMPAAPPASTPAVASASAAPPAAPAPGLDRPGMDPATKPGDDFFRHANGGWFAATEIPADRSSWGTGPVAVERTAKRVGDLIEHAAKEPGGSADAKRVGDYYATFMDHAAIEAAGLKPLEPALARIAAISDVAGLTRALAETLRADVDVLNATHLQTSNLFGVWIAQDLSDPTKYAAYLLQGGLLLPDREFYLDAAPRMAAIREKYRAHIVAVLKLANMPDAEAKAKGIFELETRLAKAHATRTDTGDVQKGNNHWSRADFAAKAPGIDWEAFFAAAGLGGQTELVVWHPKATTGIAAAVKAVPLATWKDFLAFHAIEHASSVLPAAFVDESFAFYGSTLAGTPKLRERWKRGVESTGEALGQAIGKLYVTKYFPESEKQRAAAMVKNVLDAFGKRIDGLAWMTPATKQKARAKLAVLKVGVGYPDTWRDYSALEIVKGDALGNVTRASMFEYQRNLRKLGTPVDRNEWVMDPQLVNAVNLPAMNAMNFPAAILQPPYFDPSRPAVMDYGAIGAVIGHEISHSFDDQGALFDATGKLANWWTPDDLSHFKTSSKQLVKQYDGYKPFPDLSVNGTLTLGENIADVAGLSAAYDAYRLSLDGKEAPVWEGLSGDQQFFLSFAQTWRTKFREPALRQRVVTDGHAPGEYRADTVRNIDAWYAAFKVEPGTKLYLAPADRVRLWLGGFDPDFRRDHDR